MTGIAKFFHEMNLKRKKRREIRQKMRMFDTRTKELEAAMNQLISEHMTPSSVEELYFYITLYVNCQNAWENEYCKDYIKKIVRKGYLRYDKERLK